MKKFILSCLLSAVCMLTTFAVDYSGTCGTNLTWELTNGVLTISGTGTMNDFSSNSAPWYSCRNLIKSVTTHTGVKSIGSNAFYDCPNLSSVTIGNSVTSIGDKAFYLCESLTSITIPDNVTSLGNGVFETSKLRTVTIGSGISVIPPFAFHNAGNLTSVSLPNTIIKIEESAFSACYSLEHIVLPNSLTSIGKGAFSQSFKLNSITIPNGVNKICEEAFARTGLAKVDIGTGILTMEVSAFYQCSSLADITVRATTPPVIHSTTFLDINSSYVIKVPCDNLSLYRSAPDWKDLTLVGVGGNCGSGTSENTYTVSVSSANSSMGTVSGSGVYVEGQTATVTATPKSGYLFAYWSDNSTANPYTFTVTKDVSLTASFGTDDSNKYNVSVNSANSTMGKAFFHGVSNFEELNNGQYVQGTNLIAEAIPNSGYKFKSWSDGNNSNPYGITVTRDISLLAIFEPVSSSTTCTVSVSAVNTSMGTVSGGGSYEEGQTATVTATPNSGYEFTQWSDGSTQNPYTFTVSKDITLTAYFKQTATPQTSSTFWNFSDAAFNSLGTLYSNKTINGLTIYATSTKTVIIDESYQQVDNISFTHRLKLGGAGDASYRTLKFNIDGDCTIDIYLKSANSSEDRTLRVDYGAFGSSATKTITASSSVSKATIAYSGNATDVYVYGANSGINLYGIRVSYNSTTPPASNEITCAEAAQIAAGLAHNASTSEIYTVTGYVTETDGVVSRGQQVFWMADTKNGGRVFESYWGNVSEAVQVGDYVSVKGKIMRYNSTYEIKNGNVTLISRETATNTYYVTVSSANTSMGTVSGGGTYEEGSTATVKATPKTGYKFTKWSDNSTMNPYSFTVTQEVSLTAYFEPNSESVDIIEGPFVVVAQRDEDSNWFYMTSDLGTATNKRYQAVDAGTAYLADVNTSNLDSKYYWQIEDSKLHTAAGYSTWTSGNTAILDATGKELDIAKQTDGTYTISFADGTNIRYLALNKTIGNNYFAYYVSSSLVVKQLMLLPKFVSTALDNNSVLPTEQPNVILRNGQLLILRGDKVYTVTGQEVQ